MQFYIDEANPAEIEKLYKLGIFAGVTTNPSILSRVAQAERVAVNKIVRRIIDILEGSEGLLFVQLVAQSYEQMLHEGREIVDLSPTRIVVKIPCTLDGIRAMAEFAKQAVPTCATAIFNLSQVAICCRVGASYVAPYVNRMQEVGIPVSVVGEMQRYIERSGANTRLIAASFTNIKQVEEVMTLGIYGISLHPQLYDKMLANPLTTTAVSRFAEDWNELKEVRV